MSQESSKNKNILSIIFLFVIVAAIFLVVAACFFDAQSYNDFMTDNCYEFSSGWQYTNDSGVYSIDKIPCSGISDNNTIIIENTLKEEYDFDLTVAIRTRHQFVKVFLGDEKEPIYTFDNENNRLFSKTPGCVWNYVNIPQKYYGDTIRIEYTSLYNMHYGNVEPIYYGDGKGLVMHLIKENLIGTVVSILMFGMSFFLIMLYMILKKKSSTDKLLYLSLFTFVLALWSLLENEVIQLFVRRQEIITVVTYESLMLISIPILLCIRESLVKVGRIVVTMVMVEMMAVFMACNVMQYMGYADFAETIKLVHASMVMAIFVVVIFGTGRFIVRDRATERNKLNASKLAFIILGLSICMDLVNFYGHYYNDGAMCSRIGVFFFIIILGISTMSDIYNVTIIAEKVDLWDKFAHEDILTETYNRAAFEEELHDIESHQTMEDKVALISIDVNNLKTINDTYGHAEGDAYLKECIKAIRDVIKEEAVLYRTGGDEFVIIVRPYERGQIMKYVTGFEIILRNEEEKYMYPISFAYGYSYFKGNIDKNIYDTLKRADKDMYHKKVEMKKSGADVRL